MRTELPEILAPAGSFEIMKQAFQAGADAVYLGGQLFGARAYAANLTDEELLRAIEYVQLHQKKLYLTVNTLLKNEEIDRLSAYLKIPYEAGLDAVIVQDLGVARMVRELFPDMELHASTQMSVTGPYGANLLKSLGASRIVPARELSMKEILLLKQETDLELEIFVHGALCYSYSGHCLLSSMVGGRSGNRGRCAQPCRQLYTLSNGQQGYFLSPKDLCGLKAIPDLIEAGVDSFKIEGRMKKPEYVISTVSAYRRAVDAYVEHQDFCVEEEQEQLADIFNRGNFTNGYFYQHNGKAMMAMERNHHNGIRLGIVQTVQGGQLQIKLERNLNRGDVLEIRTGTGVEVEVTSGQEGVAGQVISLNGKQLKYIQNGDTVYRTKNHLLCQNLLEINKNQRLKEKIHISVTLKKDLSAMILVACGNQTAVVKGSIVTKAQNQPLTQNTILEKVKKLGDAPFTIESITVDMDDDCFYSMKEFNQLRRQAIAELERLCSRQTTRKMRNFEDIPHSKSLKILENEKCPILAVSVSTKEQFEVVLRTEQVARVDLEAECFTGEEMSEYLKHLRKNGKQGYICLPRMFRMDMESQLLSVLELSADGYVARTLDELAFIKEHAPETACVCDYSIYAYNNEAVITYQKLGICRHLTLPVELNQTELSQLLAIADQQWEWIVYGKQPVMITAQCTVKNTGCCKKESGLLELQNSHGDEYYVHRICKYCYNVIYQKQPTCLIPFMTEWNTSVAVFRIMLTTETADETEQILQLHPKETGYYGHYKKGIE